jgi:hypothetical protein
MIFSRIIVSLVGLQLISANAIHKREDGPSFLSGVLGSILNYNFDDFVANDPEFQAINLVALAPMHPNIAEYIFTRLLPYQRYLLCRYTDQFERFVLFEYFSINGKIILLKILADEDFKMIIESQSSSFISRMVDKNNEADRAKFVQRMGPKAQIKWILGMSGGDVENYGKYLKSDRDSFRSLAKEFFRLRIISKDNAIFENMKQIATLIDDFADYYTSLEAKTLMDSKDPVLLLSRFTPTERDALRMLMRPDDKQRLLRIKTQHHLQRFPGDFLGSKAIKYGSVASDKEWKTFWYLLGREVQYDERLASGEIMRGQRRQIFPHLPKLKVTGSDVKKIIK